MENQIVFPDRWIELSSADSRKFTAELHREVCRDHLLYKTALTAAARLHRRDDFLFTSSFLSERCYVVHLTWRKETLSDIPWTTEFASFDDFVSNWKRIWD
jgi:hypothetical protein